MYPHQDQPEEPRDSVSIWFVRQALAGMQRRDRDPAPTLRACGIRESLLLSDQSRVTAASFGKLWRHIAAELDDELFGLDARRMKVGSFSLLARCTAMAPNLRQALRLAAQFFNTVMDDARVELEEPATNTEQAVIVVQERDNNARLERYATFAHETILIMLYGLMCWLIGRRITLSRASFHHAQPPWWKEYRSMYSDELAFGLSKSSLSFDQKLLDSPITHSPDSVREFLQDAPQGFIVRFKNPNSCAAQIKRRLRETPPPEWPALSRIAQDIGIALSTLHRRLDQEGVAFREIKDSLRRDMAIDLLSHSGQSISKIAAELGFAEPSAFHRAFKQWTGVRPGDYRQRAK